MTTNFMRNQKGFTLLELLLVVGVGALLLIAGITTYRLITDNNRVNDSRRLLLQIKQEVQNLYQTQSTYADLENQTVVNIGAMPENERHPFGGDILVEKGGVTTADETFSVSFDNVPVQGCVRLGTAYTDPADLESLVIGSVQLDNQVIADGDFVADVTNGCGDGDQRVEMIWEFR